MRLHELMIVYCCDNCWGPRVPGAFSDGTRVIRAAAAVRASRKRERFGNEPDSEVLAPGPRRGITSRGKRPFQASIRCTPFQSDSCCSFDRLRRHGRPGPDRGRLLRARVAYSPRVSFAMNPSSRVRRVLPSSMKIIQNKDTDRYSGRCRTRQCS